MIFSKFHIYQISKPFFFLQKLSDCCKRWKSSNGEAPGKRATSVSLKFTTKSEFLLKIGPFGNRSFAVSNCRGEQREPADGKLYVQRHLEDALALRVFSRHLTEEETAESRPVLRELDEIHHRTDHDRRNNRFIILVENGTNDLGEHGGLEIGVEAEVPGCGGLRDSTQVAETSRGRRANGEVNSGQANEGRFCPPKLR